MRLVLALPVLLIAAAGGGAAGLVLAPDHGEEGHEAAPPPEPLPEPETMPFTREFIVPLIAEGRVRGHVVLNLGLESATLTRDAMLAREPVLRDRLMEALFRHAATGGFDDVFTDALPMNRLRLAMNEAADAVLHPAGATVLITSVDRQDR